MHGSSTKTDWRPATVAEVEAMLWPSRGKGPAEIAADLGIPLSEFSAWAVRMKAILHHRPAALACLKHLGDLREEAGRRSYPEAKDADLARRERALARAAAVAQATPIWPGALDPVPYTPKLDAAALADFRGGWIDGERVPRAGRVRLDGTKRRFNDIGKAIFDEAPDDDDSDDDEHGGGGEVRVGKAADVRVTPGDSFPLTCAAAQKCQGDAWALGNALLLECGPPSGNGRRNSSYAKIDAARAALAANGIVYAFISLRFLRDTAWAFRDAERRDHAFTVYQAARTPAALAAMEESLAPGEVLTARHFRKGPRPAPGARGIAGMAGRLAAVLLTRSHAARVAAVARLMEMLGLTVEDFLRPVCPALESHMRRRAPQPASAAAAVAA